MRSAQGISLGPDAINSLRGLGLGEAAEAASRTVPVSVVVTQSRVSGFRLGW